MMVNNGPMRLDNYSLLTGIVGWRKEQGSNRPWAGARGRLGVRSRRLGGCVHCSLGSKTRLSRFSSLEVLARRNGQPRTRYDLVDGKDGPGAENKTERNDQRQCFSLNLQMSSRARCLASRRS